MHSWKNKFLFWDHQDTFSVIPIFSFALIVFLASTFHSAVPLILSVVPHQDRTDSIQEKDCRVQFSFLLFIYFCWLTIWFDSWWVFSDRWGLCECLFWTSCAEMLAFCWCPVSCFLVSSYSETAWSFAFAELQGRCCECRCKDYY